MKFGELRLETPEQEAKRLALQEEAVAEREGAVGGG